VPGGAAVTSLDGFANKPSDEALALAIPSSCFAFLTRALAFFTVSVTA
jgi:hypothetical protein